MDHFRILGVNHDASNADVRKAYLDLAKHWHPDRNSNPDAARRFQLIQEAYETLKTTDQRVIYLRERLGGDGGEEWSMIKRKGGGRRGDFHNVSADFDAAAREQAKKYSKMQWQAMTSFERLIHPKVLIGIVLPLTIITSWGMSSLRSYLKNYRQENDVTSQTSHGKNQAKNKV